MSNVDKTIIFDEEVQLRAVMNHNVVGLDKGTEITPLTTWTRILFSSIFGINTITLKLVSIIFGLLTILISYYLAKEIYDEKTAIWTTIIMGLSAWYVLGTTSISFDASFLTFYYVLTIFCFVKYINNDTNNNNNIKHKKSHFRKNYWLYLAGISFGLAMLTKLNAILIVLILIIYYFFKKIPWSSHKDNNKKTYRNLILLIHNFIKNFSIIGITSLLIFSIFPILAYFTDWSYFTIVMGHTAVFSNPSFNISLLLIQFFLAIVWIGPFLIGSYFLKLILFEKKDILMNIWIIVVAIFFTFVVQENFRPLERYFFVILPALSILAANTITKFKFEKKHLVIFLISTIFFTISFFLLNINNETIPFYPKTEFITKALEFQWNFNVPFTGDQGPIGMNVAFSMIAISFIITATLLVIMAYYFLLEKKKEYANFSLNKKIKNNEKKSSNKKISKALSYLFLMFLAITFSYNIFMLQEMIFNTTHPNIDKINKETIAYANSVNLKEPVFVFRNNAFKYYIGYKYQNIQMLDFRDEYNMTTIQRIRSGGSIIIIDFPSINKNSPLWTEINECTKIKEFSDKGQILGHIFECTELNAQNND
ncbi:MAG: ArnT family glycosyltransferase [Candidatus Woesearchaeota archaeon]